MVKEAWKVNHSTKDCGGVTAWIKKQPAMMIALMLSGCACAGARALMQ